MASSKLSVRASAASLIGKVLLKGESLSSILPPQQKDFSPKDGALLQLLCFGVSRFWFRYEAMLDHYLQKPLKKKDSDILALLAMGIFQLKETRIPDHAAISDTVEACVELKKPWAKGMINGVLRNVQRDANPPEAWQKDSRYLFSHPKWLYLKLKQQWPYHWQSIVEANNQQPPMTLRVNAQKYSRQQYQTLLDEADVRAQACEYSDVGLTLDQALDVNQLPGFAEGSVSIQDEAAQLSASLLALEPGQFVLDACCAPGGKTCHILEAQPKLSELTAVDIEERRLPRVHENLERLGLKADVLCGDASEPQSWANGKQFDRILLDAPCSATGVIRRHPDIKLLRRESDIAKLAALQLKILDAMWTILKPGGRLVYATCSLLKEENEQVIEQFLTQQSDAAHQAIEADWGIERPYGRQLFPGEGKHDGFYYAVLSKEQ